MSGEKFRIEEQYTEPRAAHLMLEHAWVGATVFQEVAETSDINNNHGSIIKNTPKWADLAWEEEFEDFEQVSGVSEK